jgi:predicted O-methyltransferase YrrM
MDQETWTAVDDYFVDQLLGTDPVMEQAQARSTAAGLPPIAVSATQGKQLKLLASMIGARRVLEVGTLGGYSAIWLARGLQADGHIDTCEIDPVHARTARANIESAGFGDRIVVHLGPASQTLARLAADDVGSYDLVFIDADKESNADYVRAALPLSHPGTVVVVDNVVRQGAVADAEAEDSAVRGTRRLFDYLAAESRLDATAIQTVGHKGYDGFALAVVTD